MNQIRLRARQTLAVKVSARNISIFCNPAVVLIDQLKQIWIDGELEPIEPPNGSQGWSAKDYQIGMNNTARVDDPDQQFFENYGCGSERNHTSFFGCSGSANPTIAG